MSGYYIFIVTSRWKFTICKFKLEERSLYYLYGCAYGNILSILLNFISAILLHHYDILYHDYNRIIYSSKIKIQIRLRQFKLASPICSHTCELYVFCLLFANLVNFENFCFNFYYKITKIPKMTKFKKEIKTK